MDNVITVYHGSNHIIRAPVFGKGRAANDYGLGFYMTRDKHLAGEWAVLWTGKNGFINTLHQAGFDVAVEKIHDIVLGFNRIRSVPLEKRQLAGFRDVAQRAERF